MPFLRGGTYYGKGSTQKHSDFKAVLCQRVYTTFKLRDPSHWWLDISCGGGNRQMVAGFCGLSALGLDLRLACVTECEAIAQRLNLSDKAKFATGDMRDVPATVERFRGAHPRGSEIQFGGMFTSIPFWRLETYDTEKTIGGSELQYKCQLFSISPLKMQEE